MKGIIAVQFENTALYLSKEHYKRIDTQNAIWLRFNFEKLKSLSDFKILRRMYIIEDKGRNKRKGKRNGSKLCKYRQEYTYAASCGFEGVDTKRGHG